MKNTGNIMFGREIFADLKPVKGIMLIHWKKLGFPMVNVMMR